MTWVNEGGLAMTWEKGGFWIPACAGMASRFGEDGDEGACNAPLHFGDTPGERELGLIPLEGHHYPSCHCESACGGRRWRTTKQSPRTRWHEGER